MTQQIIETTDPVGAYRTKGNANFTELYAGKAGKDEVNIFTAGQRSNLVSVAFGASVTIDPDNGNKQDVGAITSAFTLENFANMRVGQVVILQFTQDATGGWATTLGSYFKPYKDGVAIPTAANAQYDMICNIRSATQIAYDIREVNLA